MTEIPCVKSFDFSRTCIFLWPHWSVDDPLEGGYPIPLLRLRLAGKQELPVRCDDGDAVVPVVALRGLRQPRQDGVAVLLAADEHLAAGVRILGDGDTSGQQTRS